MTRPKPAHKKLRDRTRTRAQVVQAARIVFARNGFEGAAMEQVAQEASVSKALIYHYFGDRDALFTEALEAEVMALRGQQAELKLRALAPVEAIRQLTLSTFDYFMENPQLVALLNAENRYEGAHIRGSAVMARAYDPLLDALEAIMARGRADGVFREGVTPMALYLSIAGPCFHYASNRHTLGAVFRRSFSAPEEIERRRTEIVDFVLHGLAA